MCPLWGEPRGDRPFLVVWRPGEAVPLILSILSHILFLLSWDFAGSGCQWMASWAQSRPSKILHRNRFLRH